MKSLLLSFDTEKFPSKELGLSLDKDAAFEVGNLGLKKVIELLNEKGITATFFVTAEFAEKFPRSIHLLVKKGHEVALHGVSHEHVYSKMEPDVAQKILSKARIAMEKRFKTPVVGFRGPRMSRPSYEVLADCGFVYDSSLHPTYIPGHINTPTSLLDSRQLREIEGITIIPISVTPLLHVPFSWIWFRNMGLRYAKTCSRLAMFRIGFLHLYFHPWEFVEPLLQPQGVWQRLIFGGCGQKNLDRLERFIGWTQRKRLKASTIAEFLKSQAS